MSELYCMPCRDLLDVTGEQGDAARKAWLLAHDGHRISVPITLAISGEIGLTCRERQVLELLASGATNHTVADRLNISIKTVDTHRRHVLKKLGLRNNSDLTRFAVRNGLVVL